MVALELWARLGYPWAEVNRQCVRSTVSSIQLFNKRSLSAKHEPGAAGSVAAATGVNSSGIGFR